MFVFQETPLPTDEEEAHFGEQAPLTSEQMQEVRLCCVCLFVCVCVCVCVCVYVCVCV